MRDVTHSLCHCEKCGIGIVTAMLPPNGKIICKACLLGTRTIAHRAEFTFDGGLDDDGEGDVRCTDCLVSQRMDGTVAFVTDYGTTLCGSCEAARLHKALRPQPATMRGEQPEGEPIFSGCPVCAKTGTTAHDETCSRCDGLGYVRTDSIERVEPAHFGDDDGPPRITKVMSREQTGVDNLRNVPPGFEMRTQRFLAESKDLHRCICGTMISKGKRWCDLCQASVDALQHLKPRK
jgi:hypothetical protein